MNRIFSEPFRMKKRRKDYEQKGSLVKMTQQSDIMRDILVYGKKTELGGVSQGTFPSSSCFSVAAPLPPQLHRGSK